MSYVSVLAVCSVSEDVVVVFVGLEFFDFIYDFFL